VDAVGRAVRAIANSWLFSPAPNDWRGDVGTRLNPALCSAMEAQGNSAAPALAVFGQDGSNQQGVVG